MKVCPQCGMNNTDEAAFCRGCGVRLSKPEAPQPNEPVPPTTAAADAAPRVVPPVSAARPGTPDEADFATKLGGASRSLWGILAVVGFVTIGGLGWLLGRSRPVRTDTGSSSLITTPQGDPTPESAGDSPPSSPTETSAGSSSASTSEAMPALTGDWQGSWGGFPATLSITGQSPDTFTGVLTQRVAKGNFRIAVKGYVSPSTRSVTLQETAILAERRLGEWGTLGESNGAFAPNWRRLSGGGVTKVQKISWHWEFTR